MAEIQQVICMKWGTLYGADYVNTLYAMVKRNTTGTLRFVCFTDNAEGINPEVECFGCPTVNIPPPYNNRGWRKVSLYSDDLFGLTGYWLYLDLDVVVTGSLDEFFTYKPEKDFIVMQNWTQPGQNIGNTSVYRFNIGKNKHLLERLETPGTEKYIEYNNSQTFISNEVKDLTFWPDEWCVLFKTHCVPPWPKRFWETPYRPESAKVIAFPGEPNPHQAVNGEWPVQAFYKKLYKTIKPASWINDYWKQ